MKLTFIAFCIALALTAKVQADTTGEMDAVMESGKGCETVASYMWLVMTRRQEGASITKLIHITEKIGGRYHEMIRELTIQAFEQPRWPTPETQSEAVEDFKNDAYVACVRKYPEK